MLTGDQHARLMARARGEYARLNMLGVLWCAAFGLAALAVAFFLI